MSGDTAAPQEYTSRYRFIEHARTGKPPELRIEAKDRNTVFISTTHACFIVSYKDSTGNWHTQQFGLLQYPNLLAEVAKGLMLFWKPPEGRRPWSGLNEWARGQTRWSIGKRLHDYYKRCRGEVPMALALQRALYAATLSTPELALADELYQQKFIVQDVIQYRAAAVALATLDLFRFLEHQRGQEKDLSSALKVDEALEMMDNWRGLYSPTGESYRSLDRTLMNLPAQVPPRLVLYLSEIYLQRPVLSRSELIVLTLYLQRCPDRELPRLNEKVFENASKERIARAMQLVAEHTRVPLSFRRTRHLRFLVDFVMDYPEEHQGNIVGLAQKSIRWHRQEQQRVLEKTLNKLGDNTPTQAPPIPLPEDPNIRFLSTVKDVCEEGQRMRNCVAS